MNHTYILPLITILFFFSCSKYDFTELEQEVVKDFKVHEDLEVSLFAAEPMIANPTNIDIDEKGRIWILEAYNYRPTSNPGNPVREEGDRILILEDTDGDGKADKRKVYYQGRDIDAPLGIAVLGNKVIISRSPDVIVFTDEDGDDKPDKKEKLFTGIGGLQDDHGVHAFIFGPDGRYYFNYGNAGKQIMDRNGDPVIDLAGNRVEASGNPYRQGMVFRCNPDGSDFEVLGHNFRNIYEVSVDSYGNIWQSDNDDDGNKATRINFVVEYGNYGYTDEMTGAGWRTRRTNMHEEIPRRHWHWNDPGVMPTMLLTGAGSPAGIAFYEGDLLPEVFQNSILHTDAGPNVLRAYAVEKDGAGYEAKIINMLWSDTNQWFRPVDVCVAPDGSVFVADWYDAIVGGNQMVDQQTGRIYRIAPKGNGYAVSPPDLSTMEGMIEALKSPNQATRYLAWKGLEESGNESESALSGLWNDTNPVFRARALWLLGRLPNKDQFIEEALEDEDPNIRLTGLRVARSVYSPNLEQYMQQLTEDPSPHVRRAVAIALKASQVEDKAQIWSDLAVQYNGSDRWYLESLGLAADQNPDEYFDKYLERIDSINSEEALDIAWRVRAEKTLPILGRIINDKNIPWEDKQRYFRAFDFHKSGLKDIVLYNILKANKGVEKVKLRVLNHLSKGSIRNNPRLMTILKKSLDEQRGTFQYLDWVRQFELREEIPELLKIMLDDPMSQRGAEATFIINDMVGLEKFKELLGSENPLTVNNTIAAMGHLGGREAWEVLWKVAREEAYDIGARRKAITSMGRGWMEEVWLLELYDNGEIPGDLENTAINALMSAFRNAVRAQAREYLHIEQKDMDIEELVKQSGDPEHGAVVFEQSCAICHKVNDKGVDFGPDLSQTGSKLNKTGLYAAIIEPDAGINYGYEGYVVNMRDGTSKAGYIISQTGDELILRLQGGINESILQSEIESIEEMENSLMPAGLHLTMEQKELVDLVEYLTTLKKSQ